MMVDEMRVRQEPYFGFHFANSSEMAMISVRFVVVITTSFFLEAFRNGRPSLLLSEIYFYFQVNCLLWNTVETLLIQTNQSGEQESGQRENKLISSV